MSWPTTLDNLSTNILGSDSQGGGVHAGYHNQERDAINRLEAELGLNPSGSFADVAARLAALSASGTAMMIWLQDYGADNTGVSYCDTAFKAAMADAVTYLRYGQSGQVIISGLAGVYNLGGYPSLSGNTFFGPSLAIPHGVNFGNFGGGSYRCAKFFFPNETALPTAIGLVSSAVSIGATSIALKNVKNAFAPASATYPQYVNCGGMVVTYTGITGSGATPTLTGVTGVVSAIGVNQPCIGNTAIIMIGPNTPLGFQLDQTIEVYGPDSALNKTRYGTTLNGAAVLPTDTSIVCTNLSGWPTSGQVMLAGVNGNHVVTYTGISGGNTLTGCTSTGTGTIASGTSVFYITPPNTLDGVYMGSRGGIDCEVVGFRHATVCMADHERWGPHFAGSSCYSYVCLESPNGVNYSTIDSGNQTFHPGIDWHGATWSSFYVTAFNSFLNITVYGGNSAGFSPWFVWKEPTRGVSGANQTVMTGATFYDLAFENPGLGLIGCPDGIATGSFTFYNCSLGWTNTASSPGGRPPVAEFAVGGNFTFVGSNGGMFPVNPNGFPNTPYFMADQVSGYTDAVSQNFLKNRVVIGMAPGVVSAGLFYWFRFPGGVIAGNNLAIPKGALVMTQGEQNTNFPGIMYAVKDDGANGTLLGVAIAAFGGYTGHFVGAVCTNQNYGPVEVLCAAGEITTRSLVRTNGTVTPGNAKNASGIGDTVGIIFGRAWTNESGGLAKVVISPALA